MDTTIRTNSEAETEAIGTSIAAKLKPGSVVALSGSLGAGKTVLVRGIARGLGILSPVTSPSFTIISEYLAEVPLVHIDLYRTSSDEELELLGIEEILSRQAIIVVEWAEKGGSFIPDDRIQIGIRIDGEIREITIRGG